MAERSANVGWAHLGREALLRAVGLDVAFSRAKGDRLDWIDAGGSPRVAIDFVGGFGSTLFGHNHPKIQAVVETHLAEDRPTLVQGSLRSSSDELRNALARLIEAQTGVKYEVLLFSTGTEAVEAGLKHAKLEFAYRQKNVQDELATRFRVLKRMLYAGETRLSASFYRQCERTLKVAPIDDLDALGTALVLANVSALSHPGFFLAVEGAFHGKTMGSLAVTWNPDARQPFVRGPAMTRFLRRGETFEEHYRDVACDLYELVLEPEPHVVRTEFGRVCAVVVEPLRGEGGVYELEAEFADDLARFRRAHEEVPVLVDEVQSGLGRTGCSLESARRELPIDYLTLGKSLGGGVAKISALAIAKDRYLPEYTLLHTSTFADDDLSSAIALRTLQIIDEDGLARRAADAGSALRQELERVREHWPRQIADVRGRGLMLGIEFHDQSNNPSNAIRVLAEENVLTMLVSGHLLREHDIRVLPTVGRPSVLRFQPSAYISQEDIARVSRALEEVCAALDAGDAHRLFRYLVFDGRPARLEPPKKRPARPQVDGARVTRSRVAFIGHAIDAETFAQWDHSLAAFEPGDLDRLMQRLSGTLSPHLVGHYPVRSELGSDTDLSLIVVFMTAKEIERDLRDNSGRQIRAQVFAAYEQARALGCTMVGFGGYTSMATANCTEFAEDLPAVTTGNALTVAMGHEAIRRTAEEMEISVARATVAVCGANGNIGSVYARLLAAECGSLLLVGRPGSKLRLRALVGEVATELAMLYGRGVRGTTGLFARFVETYERIDTPPPHFEGLLAALEAALGRPLVDVHEESVALRVADVIVSASNSATPIIEPRHIAGDRPVLICDVAVPADVSAAVTRERPNARVIFGGIVTVPRDRTFELPGFPLPKGETFACAAEALVLGLSGVTASFSCGPITTDQVREIMALAKLHGFQLGSYKLERTY